MATVEPGIAAGGERSRGEVETPTQDSEFHEAVDRILPGPVVCAGGLIRDLQFPLHDIEKRSIRSAVSSRVREFTAGRTCARRALQRLGYDDVAIPVGKRRQPVWPAGIIGSISHADDYCLAAVCTHRHICGIGVDIEKATPLSDQLFDLVCTPKERARIMRLGRLSGLAAKFHFSAKESVFKCLFPVYGEELDFHDARLEIDLQQGTFRAQVSRFALNAAEDLELRGRFACTSRVVITAAVLHEDDVRHLSGWNPGMHLDNCAGHFICGLGD